LPGCVAAAKSLAGVRRLIAEAIVGHVELMREEGLPVPKPATICETALPRSRRAKTDRLSVANPETKPQRPKKAAGDKRKRA
jgi:hypothetical protein